jgi:hypothetical protein
MQRGHRYLKHFRQHIAQSRLLRHGSEQIHETSYELQHQSRRSIRI